MRRIVTAREQVELLSPWRTAFDEEKFWADHAETMRKLKEQAGGLKYVTPQPGTTLAVGPNWSGSVPSGHPDYIPRQSQADDIHGYLNHESDGHVNFVYTNPQMRGMGVGTKLLDHAGINDTAHATNFTSDGRQFADALERKRTAMSEIYDEYAGHHAAPGPGTGFPIHNMHGEGYDGGIGGVPEDWQTHPQYYAHSSEAPGVRGMKQTQQMYNRVNGKPDEMVDIYRALPHGNTSFNTGDWVTPSLAYAKGHAASEGGPEGDMPVIKSTVPAKHLWQNGDSYYEMGYHGPGHQGQVVSPAGRQAAVENEPHSSLYHVTTPEGLRGIEQHGITPQIGPRSQELGETQPASYHFPTREHMIDGLGNWLGEEFEDEDKVHMLHLRVPSTWVNGGPDSYERTVDRPIPTHMIQSIEDDG